MPLFQSRLRSRVPALLTVLLLGALAACSREPYQPTTPNAMGPSYGFVEQKLAERRYRVEASGSEATSRETLENYLLFRTAELARDGGYPGFRVLARETGPFTADRRERPGGLGRPLGYAFLPGPLYNPGYLGGPRDAYQRPYSGTRASAEVELLAELPDRPLPDVYVAREVVTQLAPSINRPGSLAR